MVFTATWRNAMSAPAGSTVTPTSKPIVIITGAGSGIGRATAQRFGRAGWRILLVGRNESRLRETDRLLAEASVQPEATELVAADITDSGQARGVVDAAMTSFGRVDLLVNNAGSVASKKIEQTNDAILQELFSVNAFGPALLIAALWQTLLRQGGGRIVNVSSMAAIDPFPGLFVYAGSKAALDGLTRSVANEGREHGIEAYSVNPGAVETKLLRSVFGTEMVPESMAMDPAGVAEVIYECGAGLRRYDNGRSIPVVQH